MKEFFSLQSKNVQYLIIGLTYVSYQWVFAFQHHRYGMVLSSLAIFPVMIASWYLGPGGGIIVVIISIFADIASLLALGHPIQELFEGAGYFIGNAILFVVAMIVGRMSTLLRERNEALQKLQEYEATRTARADFLELLNGITTQALEADNLKAILAVLTEKITQLFKADDGFFDFWDEKEEVTLPTVAYGSMSDLYPYFTL